MYRNLQIANEVSNEIDNLIAMELLFNTSPEKKQYKELAFHKNKKVFFGNRNYDKMIKIGTANMRKLEELKKKCTDQRLISKIDNSIYNYDYYVERAKFNKYVDKLPNPFKVTMFNRTKEINWTRVYVDCRVTEADAKYIEQSLYSLNAWLKANEAKMVQAAKNVYKTTDDYNERLANYGVGNIVSFHFIKGGGHDTEKNDKSNFITVVEFTLTNGDAKEKFTTCFRNNKWHGRVAVYNEDFDWYEDHEFLSTGATP